jgi:CDP-4-dehydro-6-deoxyglucose reductase
MHELMLFRESAESASGYPLTCPSEQTIYAAAQAQGFRLPASCLNGVCHICRATLVSGEVLVGVSRQRVVSDSAQSSPQVLLCQTWPLGACQLTLKNLYGPGELPLKNLKCQIVSVERLKGYVFQVDIQLPAGKLPEFFPGQYLALSLPGKEDVSYFSIASAPGLREISLHIQADPHLLSAQEVVNYLQACLDGKQAVSLSMPYGEACLTRLPEQPVVLIAAGTGFAQMKSITEYLFTQQFRLPVSLYWGVRKAEDMYLQSMAEDWAARYENFSFYPLIGELEENDSIEHHNRLSEAVMAEKNLLQSMVFVSGSPKLVFSVMDALMAAGLPVNQFYSDVLAYAVRSS